VLAELFTGSECPPCVAADMAFDHLLSAYDRKGVVVVEYHLHIPAPDPMTNADTEARAKYYGVGSTPSVLFGGTELIRGGGPKAATKNRFGLYSYAIDRRLERQAAISIALDGSVQGSSVKVEASADAGATPGDLKLRIALVEEVVHFTGANGLAEHRAVVRQMIGSPAGAALAGGKGSHSATVELSGLTGTLRAYLEEFEKNPPARFSKDYRFKEKKHEIDPANLALIAFVQDDATKEVLQASYLRLAGAAKPQSSNSRSNE
jgi:thiol-disulfide isomerase/thioredoxin